jgi:hypothetical protein
VSRRGHVGARSRSRRALRLPGPRGHAAGRGPRRLVLGRDLSGRRDGGPPAAPGPELDVVEVFPGQALFSIACIDYVDNDLGDYNEVCLALFVRERDDRPLVPYLGSVVDFFTNNLATYICISPSTRASRATRGRASGASRRRCKRST